MKEDWELLAEEPVTTPDEPPAWWKVHPTTFLGSVIMLLFSVYSIVGAVDSGGWQPWVASLGFTVNGLALLGVARAQTMMRAFEGGDRTYAPVSELGPWGKREWWLTVTAFAGFVVAIATILLA